MPAAVSVTYGGYRSLRDGLEILGFKEIPRWVKQRIVRYRNGVLVETFFLAGEIGFEFSYQGYLLRVWTSCDRKLVEQCDWMPSDSFDIIVGRPAGEDAGWIVVLDVATGRVQYFARKVLRTKNFVQNFLERTRLTGKRAFHRPQCEQCDRAMELIQKKDTGRTFWACFNKEGHIVGERIGKPVWKDWNFCLTTEELRTVKNWGRSRRRSRKKAQKQCATEKASP
jgi:hypothetical protein